MKKKEATFYANREPVDSQSEFDDGENTMNFGSEAHDIDVVYNEEVTAVENNATIENEVSCWKYKVFV